MGMILESHKLPALTVEGLTVQFGGLLALSDVSMEIKVGARYGILGPNGAGKTTLFNTISGFVQPSAGRVMLNGEDISKLRPHHRVTRGLVRTFQITTLFPELTVLENVLMAALVQAKRHQVFWQSAVRDKKALEIARDQLDVLQLGHLAGSPVVALSYGEQRLLEIAVAMASKPSVLMLDEPTAGLSTAEMHEVITLINALPQNLTMAIIEHDIGVIFEVAEELCVLHFGEVIVSGPVQQIRQDARVKEVYLGNA